MSKNRLLDFNKLKVELGKLLQRNPLTSSEGRKLLGAISQQSFSNLVRDMGRELVVMGRARNTQYALKRKVAGYKTPVQIYEIDKNGSSALLGTLTPVHPRGFYFESVAGDMKHFDDFPYFLEVLRPAGFMGRLIPLQHPDERYPSDIRNWSADDILAYLTKFGWNPLGNLIIGDEALQLYFSKIVEGRRGILEESREAEYQRLADDILGLGEQGSSAVGEQPKFICESTFKESGTQPVIVKFSPGEDSALAARRADLLICEHLAHEVLRKNGIPSTRSSIIQAGERTFLEMRRFDRTETGGRVGVMALDTLNNEFVGFPGASWSDISKELLAQKLIGEEVRCRIVEVELFGRLIGNSDMHGGNLSFYIAGLNPTDIVPVYDMLPMFYAPQNENIVKKSFVPQMPEPEYAQEWKRIYPLSLEYWKAVCGHKLVSTGFREIGNRHLKEIEKLEAAIKLLP